MERALDPVLHHAAAMSDEDQLGPEDIDERAMRRLSQGNVEALGLLYDRHQGAVRRFADRMLGSGGDVDEVVHATFLELMKSAPGFDLSRSVRAWVLGIAATVVQRGRVVSARRTRILKSLPPPSSEQPDPERLSAAREELGWLSTALSRMNEAKRAVLLLIEVEGLRGEEVAQALEIPIGTVWTRLHHARKELMAAHSKREGS